MDAGRLTLASSTGRARLDAGCGKRRYQLEDVALRLSTAKSIVERSDERPGRLEDHLVVRVVGDGAAQVMAVNRAPRRGRSL
jgi:hypothetical protein